MIRPDADGDEDYGRDERRELDEACDKADDIRDRELKFLRARVTALEQQLSAGRRLVHASVDAQRVSPRLVAWAGEPDQSGKGGR